MFKQYPFFLAILLIPIGAIADLHDPTLPGNLPPVQSIALENNGEAKLNLTAIWISNKARRAIINGTTVTAGQALTGGTHILKIHLHYVLIRQNGRNKQLYLVPFVKHPVK